MGSVGVLTFRITAFAVFPFRGWVLPGLHLLADDITFDVTRLPQHEDSLNVGVKCSLHFPNLKGAPHGSFMAQHIQKCIVAHFGNVLGRDS